MIIGLYNDRDSRGMTTDTPFYNGEETGENEDS